MNSHYSRPSVLALIGCLGTFSLAPGVVAAQTVLVHSRAPLTVTGPNGRPAQPLASLLRDSATIVAVEGETNSLLVLSHSGDLRSRLRNTGPGGAMLAHPTDMTITPDGRILVLDGQTPRIAQFTLDNDSLQLNAVVRLRGITGVSALCTVGNKTYLLGFTPPVVTSDLVHLVDDDGEVSSGFGEGFGPAHEFARMLFGVGHLLCPHEQDFILVASQYFPEVRAYSHNGSLVWRTEFPDYRPVSFTETAPGRMEYAFPADSLWDRTVSAFEAGPGVVAVQVARHYGRNIRGPMRQVRTFVLSASTGRVIGVQSDLPVITHSRQNRMLAVDQATGLWLLVHAYEDHPPND